MGIFAFVPPGCSELRLTLTVDGEKEVKTFNGIATGVFGNVVGDIINLKINEICINTKATDALGSLANKVTGDLNNVAVVGDLNSSKSAYLGGVVGVLYGNATAVDAVVNISNNAFGSITGGVVGWFVGEDNEISYSSNSGMIINTNSNTKEDGDSYIIKYGEVPLLDIVLYTMVVVETLGHLVGCTTQQVDTQSK